MIRGLCRTLFTYPCPRKLREVVKMSLLEKEPPAQVEIIWNKYHSDRPNNVSTVVSSQKYTLFRKRAQESPFFILPVARDAGHFVLLLQAQGNSNLFTFLEDYKRNPTGATPYFVVTLFEELLFKKLLAPVRGDIVDSLVTKPEAQILMKAFLEHYTDEDLYSTVHKFNHQPELFHYDSFINAYFARFK
mmetsp:Transcript_7558/g.14079  ORF Transcript_7558/g.14079 Transcript_7558/m.14079 type:complete len:189 (-) Transcript_7558:505-1071(-)